MSEFKVDIRKIIESIPHPDADRLDVCKVNGLGFQFVTSKGEYSIGDLVVYFPIDSVLPTNLIEFLGVGNFLAGKEKNRIKTAKLRGVYSQGLVYRLDKLSSFLDVENLKIEDDVTEILGVQKYDPPEIMSRDAVLFQLPDGVEVYDIESCDRYLDILEYLKNNQIPVVITEKLEGTNWGCTVKNDGSEFIHQRQYSISLKEGEVNENNIYIKTTHKEGLMELAKNVMNDLGSTQVTIRGELLGPGIQGNIYNFPSTTIKIFDIKSDYKYLSHKDLCDLLIKFNMYDRLVPVLDSNVYLGSWLGTKTIQEASTGFSILNESVLREGIVIKPIVETSHLSIGRLIIKQRSPEYLAKSKL